MVARLDAIYADLLRRREQAETEGCLGELEGIDLTFQFLQEKLDEAQRIARNPTTSLGMPALRSS